MQRFASFRSRAAATVRLRSAALLAAVLCLVLYAAPASAQNDADQATPDTAQSGDRPELLTAPTDPEPSSEPPSEWTPETSPDENAGRDAGAPVGPEAAPGGEASGQEDGQGAEATEQASPAATLMPIGFGGIRLGAPLSALAGLKPLGTQRVENLMDGDYDLAWYVATKAPKEFAGAPLDRVDYAFRDGILAGILVRVRDEAGWRRLLTYYQRRFGTDERSAFAYDTIWDRVYREWTEKGEQHCAWITCERQTDNCAVSSLILNPATGKGELRIGEHL